MTNFVTDPCGDSYATIGTVRVELISLPLPPGATDADARAALEAHAEQEGYWLLFPERLTDGDC